MNRDIEAIDVPALVCASFSDHNLHSRGTFEGYRRIASTQKWLYTHRGPKWATFYSDDAVAVQAKFFDHFLRGDDNGMPDEPRVRVELREDASTITAVRTEAEWPPPGTRWEPLHLASGGRLSDTPEQHHSRRSFDARREHLAFTYRFAADTELVTVSTPRGAISLPLAITEMPDRVVWLPLKSPGSAVAATLRASIGDVVAISPGGDQT